MAKWKSERMNEYFKDIRPFPKAKELLAYLHNNGIKVGIATSSAKEVFEKKMEKCQDLLVYVDVVVCGDDPNVKRSKPAPDIFIRAAQLCGETDMKRVFIFEDAPNGVEAAIASGGYAIAIPDSHVRDMEVMKRANMCLDSLASFEPAALLGTRP